MNDEIIIVKVDSSNYLLFDNMVFFRMNGREKYEEELDTESDFSNIYEALANPDLFVYAAMIDKRFIAWISIVYIPKVGRTGGRGHMFIDELWVSPEHRKKGIAKALMKKADELSREFNTLGTRLYVNTDNEEAIQLYQKCRYTGIREAFFMEKLRQ